MFRYKKTGVYYNDSFYVFDNGKFANINVPQKRIVTI